MLLAMLVAAQIALGLSVAAEDGLRRWGGILGLVFLATLGVLAKGAVGCILPWLVLVLYFGSQGDWKALRRLGLRVVIPGTLALVGFWLAMAGSTAGWRYPTDLLFHQTIQRYLDPWHHHKPVFYYLQVFLTDGLPYSLLFLPLGWFLVRECRWRRPEVLLPLAWIGVYLLLFSLSSGKRSVYIFPLLPAVALLIAWGAIELQRGTWPARSFRWALWATAGLAAAGFALTLTRLPSRYESLQGVLAVGALLLVTGCLSAAWLLKQRRAIAAIVALAGSSLVMMPATVLPAVRLLNAVKVPQQFVELTRPSRRDGGTLGVYPALIASLNFYARTNTPVFPKDQEGDAVAFLANDSRNRLVALAKDWGPPNASVEVLYEGPIGDDSYLLLRAPGLPVVPPDPGDRLFPEGPVS
jgi:4-amino-4-deoxy-L-arabinose transferase-like glycosyltransferase